MKKYRLFGKIPVFDVILAAVVIAVGIAAYAILTSGSKSSVVTATETKTIRYTVEFMNLSNMVEGVPDDGEKVFDNLTNYEMGTVMSTHTEPFTGYSYNNDTGETVATKYSDRQNVYVVVEAKANVSEKCTEINNVKIGLGKAMTFSMPSLCASGVIIDMEEV